MKSLWLGYITKMLQLLCLLPHFSATFLYKYCYAMHQIWGSRMLHGFCVQVLSGSQSVGGRREHRRLTLILNCLSWKLSPKGH